jgi:hypothetical protein
MIAAIWIVAALGMACWTLAVWAVWVLLSWDPAWVARLKITLEQWPGVPWLNTWWPDWDLAVMTVLKLVQHVLGFAVVWLPAVLGCLWLVGSLLALGLAALLHVAVRAGTRAVPAKTKTHMARP